VSTIHEPLVGRVMTARVRLLAAALCALALAAAGTFAGGASAAVVGEFQGLASSSVPLTSMTVDPTTNLIYAQENEGTKFFSYDPTKDTWSELEAAPLDSGNNGGAAYLNGKIYTVYTNESTSMGVYDIASNTWSTIPNPLGQGTGNITAVGESLYLVVGTHFVKYDPATETTTPLAEALEFTGDCSGEGFEPWGGLQSYQGKIYGHQGNGCDGFAVYDIEANEWTELPELPEDATLGSAIDPVAGAYYAYGSYGGTTFMRYDIAANEWATALLPFAEVEDGGMAYVSVPGLTGIYLIEGEEGTAFARFTSEELADLALTKKASVASTTVGAPISYTIDVANNGPTLAKNVTVSDPLPANVSLVSSSATQGSCSGTTTLSCSLGTLLKGASATVTVTVTAASAGTATNTASVSSAATDPNPANNSASASTVIAAAASTAHPPLLPARWLVPGGILRVSRGWVSAPLVNLNSQLTLSGSAQLVSYVAAGKAGAPTVLATNSVYLSAGATKTLYLHLNSAALAKLASQHRFNVQLQLTLTDQFGRQVKPTGVYLLRGPAHRHKHHKRANKNKKK
jgi:uncharacterized repeat protein (TIGR01451 family)